MLDKRVKKQKTGLKISSLNQALVEIRHNLKSSFSGTAQWGSGVQPSHVQEDGEEEAGQEGEVQDAARHIHGDQGGDGD